MRNLLLTISLESGIAGVCQMVFMHTQPYFQMMRPFTPDPCDFDAGKKQRQPVQCAPSSGDYQFDF